MMREKKSGKKGDEGGFRRAVGNSPSPGVGSRARLVKASRVDRSGPGILRVNEFRVRLLR